MILQNKLTCFIICRLHVRQYASHVRHIFVAYQNRIRSVFAPYLYLSSGIRSRSMTSPSGLCFKVEVCWLSGVCRHLVRRLCLTAQTLVSVTSNTSVCRLEHLPLSRQRLAAVKTGGGGRGGVKGSLLPDRCKPVHSGNIRPIGCNPDL